MKSQPKFQARNLSKYDIVVVSVITVCIILALVLWIWYGYKTAELEQEILRAQ